MTFNKSCLTSGAVLGVVTSLLVFAAACGGGGGSSASSGSIGGTGGGTGVSSGGDSGGGSGSSSGLSTACGSAVSNCAALTSDNGLPGGYVNGAFTNVTVCVPGTTTCVTVSGVLVDTGSVGLRLLKSKVSSITLPQSKATTGALAECYTFVDGYIWGPVATADIQIGGEIASSAPIMLIDDSTTLAFTPPTSCTGSGSTAVPGENSQAALLANGILGIGSTKQDCGPNCALPVSSQTDSSGQFAGLYYGCTSSSNCTGTSVALTAQVPNPVSQFTKDNNGTAISLPTVPSAGAATLTGALYFGIGTESNNTMPSTAAVLTLDTLSEQFITTTYKGTSNPQSYIDSGSNGLIFVDSAIPACPSNSAGSAWFCPPSTLALSATNAGAAGSSGTSTVSFSVANANTLFSNNSGLDDVFSDLGGPGTAGTFDWGLPFFYGRVVYNAIELAPITNAAGATFTGPFVAY